MLSALAATPKPPGIAALPTDQRGFPIAFITDVADDGTPDFRITDMDRWLQVVQRHLCGMCGRALVMTSPIAFIGSEANLRTRLFFDPGMHVACADYATAVCPFLAISTARRSRRELPPGFLIVPTQRQRPERMFVMQTYGYDVLEMTPDAEFRYLIQPWSATDLRWF